jgi:hypothetical protein
LAVTLIVASLAAGGGARAFQAPPAAPAPGVQAANRPDRMGAISEISGDTYTLTSRRGTVKALILSSVPISGVQGAAASRADLKVGVRIGVFGTAKDDGSMVATRVIVLPAGARPGGPVTPAAPALSPEALAASKALLEKDTPEITVDTTGAPDLAGFASRAKGICEAMYPAIAAYLHTDGVTPPKAFTLTFREMDGVAYTSGDGCHFAAAYFRTHSDDYGAVVHEMTHVIQAYHGNNPGWLVEALDDYVRFYRYEPVSKALHFTSDRVPNDPQAYQIGAQFLNYVQTKYDNTLTPELNTAMRKGAYSDDIWTQKTGKTLAALWAEWKASLPSAAPKAVAAKP